MKADVKGISNYHIPGGTVEQWKYYGSILQGFTTILQSLQFSIFNISFPLSHQWWQMGEMGLNAHPGEQKGEG